MVLQLSQTILQIYLYYDNPINCSININEHMKYINMVQTNQKIITNIAIVIANLCVVQQVFIFCQKISPLPKNPHKYLFFVFLVFIIPTEVYFSCEKYSNHKSPPKTHFVSDNHQKTYFVSDRK